MFDLLNKTVRFVKKIFFSIQNCWSELAFFLENELSYWTSRTLEDDLEGAKAKLAEYEESLVAMEKGEVEERLGDATRKVAILRSNEAIMVRRYQVSMLSNFLRL
jgi:hypothetical protein